MRAITFLWLPEGAVTQIKLHWENFILAVTKVPFGQY